MTPQSNEQLYNAMMGIDRGVIVFFFECVTVNIYDILVDKKSSEVQGWAERGRGEGGEETQRQAWKR